MYYFHLDLLSYFSDAPTRLKKELDTVLSLQGQMEAIDQAIHTLQTELSKADAPQTSIKLLSNLQHTQEEFKVQGEALYSYLNVYDSFPELANIDLDFVCILLTARDLKINIQKRAIGSFLEWDKLDQAMGGCEQSLGTPTTYTHIKAVLMQSPLSRHKTVVWMQIASPSHGSFIQFQYVALTASPGNTNHSTDHSISTLLQQQFDHLLLLKWRWSSPLASTLKFEAHIDSITTALPIQSVTWILAILHVANKDLVAIDTEEEPAYIVPVMDDHMMDDLTLSQGTDVAVHSENREDDTLLVNFLLEAEEASDKLVDGAVVPRAVVPIIWELPVSYFSLISFYIQLTFLQISDSQITKRILSYSIGYTL
ncbi:hypothetical protein C0991_008894 [Blastosporella zonata]|nr:hypothetical protein C0991_008894 [Blastosporella zonata]